VVDFLAAHKRDMLAAIILVFWFIWRHQNDVFFNGSVASQYTIKNKVCEKFDRWRLAKLLCRGGARI
jgi:hypothetical protein